METDELLPPRRLTRGYSVVMRKEFKYRKPVCPFISSTFQDFQVERDYLMRKIFPAIGDLCHKRGTYCAPVDLRWGINANQVNSGLVVQLCLDYIVRCAPFFICLLGERYGSQRPEDAPTLPEKYDDLPEDASWLDKSLMVAAAAGYDWVREEMYEHCSVTELEIIQAAFLSESSDFCYFYFRQPDHVEHLFTDLPEEERQEKLAIYAAESEDSSMRMKDLKARIVNKGLPIRYFATPEELGRQVLQDWTKVVELLYPPLQSVVCNNMSQRFHEWMAHETFAETRRRVFIRTPEFENLMDELSGFAVSALHSPSKFPQSPDSPSHSHSFSALLRKKVEKQEAVYQSILLLMGERGSGKTALMANWVKEFKEHHGQNMKIFSHYVGSSAHSSDITSLLRRCTLSMRDEYPNGAQSDMNAGSDEMTDFHHVCEAFVAAVGLGPCVLIIDGVDELGGTYGMNSSQVKEMTWLPNPLPPQCKVIITSARSDASFRVLSSRPDTRVLRVPLLTDTEAKKEVICQYLAIHCKCLTEQQLNKVVSCKLSDRPLFLSALANELRVFGVNSHLDFYLDSYLETGCMQQVWSKIILRWIKDYSWTTSRTGSVCPSPDCDPSELKGWVADALRLIAVSRNGLSQDELLELLEDIGYYGNSQVTSFDWALFRSAALDGLFERPGGLLSFFHQHFKEAAEYTLLGSVVPPVPPSLSKMACRSQNVAQGITPSDRITYHCYLAKYFQRQETLSDRRINELPWQLEKAGEMEKLRQFLMEPEVFMELCGNRMLNNRRLELLQYWKTLTGAGFSPAATYWQMLKKAGMADKDDVEDEPDTRRRHSLFALPPLSKSIFSCSASSHDLVRSGTCTEDSASQNWKFTDREIRTERDCDPDDLDEEEDDDTQSKVDAILLTTEEQSKLASCAGQFLTMMGHFCEAEQMLLSAHHTLNQLFPLDREYEDIMCEIEESLGNLYLYQLRQNEAAYWYHRALDAVSDLTERSTQASDISKLMETKGRLMDHLGNMKIFTRRFSEAERFLLEAKTCFQSAGSLTGKAFVEYHIGVLRLHQGKYENAEEHLLHAMTSLERWYGKSHPRVADALNDMAGLLCNPRNKDGYDPQQAEKLYRRALCIRERTFGGDHLLVATTLFHLGKLLKDKKTAPQRIEATQHLQRALDIRISKLGTDHQLTKRVRRVLSHLEIENKLESNRKQQSARSRASYGQNLTVRKDRQKWLRENSEEAEDFEVLAKDVSEVKINGEDKSEENEKQEEPLNLKRSFSAPVHKALARHPRVSTSRRVDHRRHSAPVGFRKYVVPRSSSAVHRKSCYQPSPHSIDIHNSYSPVNGPNSDFRSLLGPPPTPRYVSGGVLHQSAWYQVPGRYSTVKEPIPRKRSQRRVKLKNDCYSATPSLSASPQVITTAH